MKITADTNVLVRALIDDHPIQSAAAKTALRDAERVAIPLMALAEMAWVLRKVYRKTRGEIASSIAAYTSDPKVETDLAGVDAGLRCLKAGADFADGVIAFEGQRLGGDAFVTFDRRAAQQLRTAGVAVALLP